MRKNREGRFDLTSRSSRVKKTLGTTSSDYAQFFTLVRRLPETREAKVNRIKTLVQQGIYETQDKIASTVERLIDVLMP